LRRPLLGQLVAYAANGTPLLGPGASFGWRVAGADARQFQWALDAGLGPLLYRATSNGFDAVPRAWRDALLGADLSARVRHAALVESALEVVAACGSARVRPTLLKGISVSEELYPAEHLRPMGDIDVLVPAASYEHVERALLDRNFRRLDYPEFDAGHHHGTPLCHASRLTVVELHTALFSDDSPLREGSTFAPSNVAAQSTDSRYHGEPVLRLSRELQLVYIASSWFNDLTRLKFQPSFLASLFDAVYLLATARRTLDWNGMLAWLDNPLAKASLYAMLTYLPRYGVEAPAPQTLARLASGQHLVGPLQLKLIHRMLDRHLIAGKPWNHVLPPPVPGRYSPRHQFRKRVLARLRRRWARSRSLESSR
jgi:hypothetical protein